MATKTTTDYPSLWDRYNREGKNAGLTIQEFCEVAGVPYSNFNRWYKKNIGDVSIVPLGEPQPSVPLDIPYEDLPEVVSFSIELKNSLRITQRNIDLVRLNKIVKTLGGLC